MDSHHRRFRLAIAILMCLSLMSCGNDDEEGVAGVPARSDETSSTNETGRPTRSIPDTSIPPPDERALDNTNVRDGALGNACWVVYQLGLQIIDATNANEKSPDEAKSALVILRETARTEAKATLEEASIPEEATSFVEELVKNVDEIASMSDDELTLESVTALLPFDKYLGWNGFEEAAKGNRSCPRFQG